MNNSTFGYSDLLNESNVSADNMTVSNLTATNITSTDINTSTLNVSTSATIANPTLSGTITTNLTAGKAVITNLSSQLSTLDYSIPSLAGALLRRDTVDGSGEMHYLKAINTTNQLRLGTTNTTTINSVAPTASLIVRIIDAGVNSDFVLTEATQSINGFKTFLLTTTFVDIKTNSIIVNLNDTYRIGSAGNRYLEIHGKTIFTDIIDSPTTPIQILKAISGLSGVFSGTLTASNLSGTNTGDITLANIGSVPNAQGASLSGQQLTLQPASNLFGGVLTTIAQNIGGDKTFKNNITMD